jgi:hypothetical protein
MDDTTAAALRLGTEPLYGGIELDADRPSVCDLARGLTVPMPVRCIIGANETTGNFRFHQLRADERWNSADLDSGLGKIVVVDSQPPH